VREKAIALSAVKKSPHKQELGRDKRNYFLREISGYHVLRSIELLYLDKTEGNVLGGTHFNPDIMHPLRNKTSMVVRWPNFLLPILGLLVSCAADHPAEANHPDNDPRPRLLILTDIGGDPDDQQSLIRLSLYFNEFEIEGLITSASGTPGELGEAVIKPHLIEEIIQAYGEVSDNLRLHDPTYPDYKDLLQKIKKGNPNRGMDHIGEGHNTEGSEWIIKVVDREDSRPINIAIWGGQTDLFQALWKVAHTRTVEQYHQFVSRMRIYDIADQDEIFEQVIGDYPGLFYILNKAPEGEDRRKAVFRGMYLGGDESLTSLDWIRTHVQEGHGPLGALYPLKTWTAPNPHGVLKEGDTPSWFYFLPNGLGHPDHPQWGGWGGRFEPGEFCFVDAEDTIEGSSSTRSTVWRWRPHFQNEFQARMDWCIAPYKDANHAPEIVVNGIPGRKVLVLEVAPGEQVSLTTAGTTDPDGDDLSYKWFSYSEAGNGNLVIGQVDGPDGDVKVPEKASPGEEFHLILQVTDHGLPPLTSYRRMVFRIR